MDLFAKVYPSYSPIIFDLYKIILCAVSSLAIVSVVVSVVPFQAFGDGFTQENVYASVGNRKMAMFVKNNPPILTSQNLDRKSTRLNSSHQIISYAVFCLKKKKKKKKKIKY